MRALFKKFAGEHVEKFASLREQLIKELGILPRVPTFQYLATVYTEDCECEKAIEVCKKAIEFGLHDGTKGGFPGRIERIVKKIKQIFYHLLILLVVHLRCIISKKFADLVDFID